MPARSAEVFVDENGYFESQGVLYKVDINKKRGRNRASQPKKVGEYIKTSFGRVLFREDGIGTTVKDSANPQHGDVVLRKRANGKFDIIKEYIKDKDGVAWVYTSQNGVRTKTKFGNQLPKVGNTEWLVENGNATRKLREYDNIHGKLREITFGAQGKARFEDKIEGGKIIWTKDGKGNWNATALVITSKGKEIHAKKIFDKDGTGESSWAYRDGNELKAIKDVRNHRTTELLGKYITKGDTELLFRVGKNGELYHQTGKAAGDEIYRFDRDTGRIVTIGKLVDDGGVIRTLQMQVGDNKMRWFFSSADGEVTFEYFMEDGTKRIYSHKDYDIHAQLDMTREFDDNDNLKPVDMIHQYDDETGELICCVKYFTGSDGALKQVQVSAETDKDLRIYRSKGLFSSSGTAYGVGWLLEDENGSIESVKHMIQPYKGTKHVLEMVNASRGIVKERGLYDGIVRDDSFDDWMNDRGMFDEKNAMYARLKANNPMYGVDGAVRSLAWDPATGVIHGLSGTTIEKTIITLDGTDFSAEIFRDERTKKPIFRNVLDEDGNIMKTQFFSGLSSFWQGREEVFCNSIRVNGMFTVGTQDGDGIISGVLKAIADAIWQQDQPTLSSFSSKDLE